MNKTVEAELDAFNLKALFEILFYNVFFQYKIFQTHQIIKKMCNIYMQILKTVSNFFSTNKDWNELSTILRNKMADELRGCYTLHEMFTIVGSRMTQRDINILKYLYNGIMPQRIIGRVKDGVEFLLGLEKMNRVDETNFKYVVDLLRMISRHDLLQFVTLRKRKPGKLFIIREGLTTVMWNLTVFILLLGVKCTLSILVYWFRT